MNLNSKNNWIRRSMGSAILSAAALSLPQIGRLQPYYWAPGFFFALLVVRARSRQAELMTAVVLAYFLGYSSGDALDKLGLHDWPLRIASVAIGSLLLTFALRWKGGLKDERMTTLAMLGTALAVPFWWFILRQPGGGGPALPLKIAAFSAWQMPMAWYYLKED